MSPTSLPTSSVPTASPTPAPSTSGLTEATGVSLQAAHAGTNSSSAANEHLSAAIGVLAVAIVALAIVLAMRTQRTKRNPGAAAVEAADGELGREVPSLEFDAEDGLYAEIDGHSGKPLPTIPARKESIRYEPIPTPRTPDDAGVRKAVSAAGAGYEATPTHRNDPTTAKNRFSERPYVEPTRSAVARRLDVDVDVELYDSASGVVPEDHDYEYAPGPLPGAPTVHEEADAWAYGLPPVHEQPAQEEPEFWNPTTTQREFEM